MRRSHILAGLTAIALACLAMPTGVRADDASGRTAVGFESGLMKLTGGDRDYSNAHPFLDLDLRRGLAPHWSLDFAFKYGWVRPGAAPGEDAGLTTTSLTSLYTVIWQPRFGLIWHAAPAHRLSPFLGLSGGVTSWRVKDLHGASAGLNPAGTTVLGYDEDGNRRTLTGNDPTVSAAVGFDLFASANLAFSLGARYHAFPGNKLDDIGYSDDWYYYGPTHVDASKGLVEAFLGARLWFGSADRDHDGIADRRDGCPDQPEDIDGFQDQDGCPDLDNDGDGIPDRRDSCPNVAEDKDGFQDDDGCPDLDNDGDGIPDALDKCPDAAEDRDGYQDDDGCPDPDNDGDNVLDAYDRCPDTPAGVEVDSRGCPIVRAAPAPAPTVPQSEEIKGDLILDGVNFFSGNADLTPASLEILRKVAESLAAWPDVTIEIRGHTDDAGPAEANRDLSQRRALSVRDRLIGFGISANRLSAVGYGEDYPIADNRTPAGRAANRRVEIHRMAL
ncbi:MAG: OmpA family protein [Candidatus Krumholzibacteriia bacterium]